jgi:hypothetical protein
MIFRARAEPSQKKRVIVCVGSRVNRSGSRRTAKDCILMFIENLVFLLLRRARPACSARARIAAGAVTDRFIVSATCRAVLDKKTCASYISAFRKASMGSGRARRRVWEPRPGLTAMQKLPPRS